MINLNGIGYTWEQLVEMYPDKWIVVENYDIDLCFNVGDVIGILTDDEIMDFRLKCSQEGRDISFDRTTEKSFIPTTFAGGII